MPARKEEETLGRIIDMMQSINNTTMATSRDVTEMKVEVGVLKHQVSGLASEVEGSGINGSMAVRIDRVERDLATVIHELDEHRKEQEEDKRGAKTNRFLLWIALIGVGGGIISNLVLWAFTTYVPGHHP